eukprot:SAG22_NODE_5228_length_1057_cov_1.552192_1_plen_207_part_01
MPKKPKGTQQVRQSAGRAADPSATKAPETKKDIEARQQQLKDLNHRKALEKVQQHNAAKEKAPRSIFETHSLVQKDAGSTQLEEVPDVSERWVALHKIDFLAFLPQDNTGRNAGGQAMLAAGSSDRDDVLKFCNRDCATMLRLPHHEFWSHALHNRSFQRFKDTYLRHCRRYFDDEWSALALGEAHRRSPPPSKNEADLSRRVFFIL